MIYKTHFPNQLFIGCFPEDNTSLKLRQFFSQHGTIIEAKFIMNKSRQSKAFGFCCVMSKDCTDKVLEELSEDLDGMTINIQPAVKRIRKDSTGMHTF